CVRARSCSESALRVGSWLAFERTINRKRGDGGVALNWSGVATDSLSAFALDLGAGRADSGVNDVVARLSWGIRSVRMRTQIFHESGVCRAVIAPASGVGAYVAARREIGNAQAFEVTAGIELHPFVVPWAAAVHSQD